MEPIVYNYVHSHNCPLEGEVQPIRPEIVGSVLFLVHPTCVYTLTELELQDIEGGATDGN